MDIQEQQAWYRQIVQQIDTVLADPSNEMDTDIVFTRSASNDGTTFTVRIPETPPFTLPDTSAPPPSTAHCVVCNQDRVLVVWLMLLQARLDSLILEFGTCRPQSQHPGPRDPPPPAAPVMSSDSTQEVQDEQIGRGVAALSLVEAREMQTASPVEPPVAVSIGRGRGARRLKPGRGRAVLAAQALYRQLEQARK